MRRGYIVLIMVCFIGGLSAHEQQAQESQASFLSRLYVRVLTFLKIRSTTPSAKQQVASHEVDLTGSLPEPAPGDLTDPTQRRSRATCPGCPGTDVWEVESRPLTDFNQKRERGTCPGCPRTDEWNG